VRGVTGDVCTGWWSTFNYAAGDTARDGLRAIAQLVSQACGWTYQSDPTFAWSDPTDSDGVGWMERLERV
jgi:hypothetical protein